MPSQYEQESFSLLPLFRKGVRPPTPHRTRGTMRFGRPLDVYRAPCRRMTRHKGIRNGSTRIVCLNLLDFSYIARTSGHSRYPGIFECRSGWCSCSIHSVAAPGIPHTRPGRCTPSSPGRHTRRGAEAAFSPSWFILFLPVKCKEEKVKRGFQAPFLAALNSSRGGFSSAMDPNNPDLVDPAAGDI